ncbi:NAD(P)/FAD-dependent oxidoreductase [Actinoplanes sp. OR16]|uniref:NAD(P)/FAD-dependent oxidoreductase n=1 Tax=Actinoplanes sp. OR16 TaxID=946334 RepID=UPI0015758225|nr:NAD(P)/FAD-dependent oxidoreductase [Actinoplanes sp. OR16]
MTEQGQHRVVIVGAGFAGKYAARALRRADAHVTVINGTNHHVFEPLIYQVATGLLSPGEVATPVRELFRGQRNTDVLLGWVTDVDVEGHTVTATAPDGVPYQVPYDTLIVSAGTTGSYFGNDRFAEFAPGLKSIDDAVELRARILTAFEMAELTTDPEAARRWLTFVIVGAGPTGVELAGQIAEIARRTLPGEYRRIDPAQARIVLVDAVDRVLPTFSPESSAAAEKHLRKIGVDVRLGKRVVDVDATGVEFQAATGTERLDAMTKIWSAGVAAAPLARRLAAATGAETDRSGRIKVNPDLTVPGHPEIFVLGDLMSLGKLPGVAQVSIQGGAYAGRTIRDRLAGQSRGKSAAGKPFHYFDKGNIATVSRFSAVADLRGLHLRGLLGWLLWLGVHWAYLPKGRNRASSLVRWAVAFLGRSRSERAVTSQQINARLAVRHATAEAGEKEKTPV